MIEWNMTSNSIYHKEVRECLMDILLGRACIDNDPEYNEYVCLLESGKDLDLTFPGRITQKIISYAPKLNWQGYIFN